MSIHNRKCLVLNRNWHPIDVISLEDAIRRVFSEYDDGQNKARILDPSSGCLHTWDEWSLFPLQEGEDCIMGVHAKYKVPEIIVMSNYEKLPMHKSSFSRRNVIKRDKNQCQYCGKIVNLVELTIDHVEPKSRGGKSTWDNCVAACKKCNRYKADRTPPQANMQLIKEPKRPEGSMFKFEGIKHCKSWEPFIKQK